MTTVTLIFPHQLFVDHPCIVKDQDVYLIEEFLFFNQYCFHQHKLVLHRASMKKYAHGLGQFNVKVNYIDSQDDLSDVRNLINHLAQQNITEIQCADVADNWLKTRIKKSCNRCQIKMTEMRSPNFLNTLDEVKPYFDKKKTYFQTAFYIEQRKQRLTLLDAAGHPLAGQWTFDTENRLKYPKNTQSPEVTVDRKSVV